MPPKTQREREAEQRKAKLDRIDEQVKDGSLVIRKMTAEERERFAGSREEGRAEGQRGGRRRRRSPATAPRPIPPSRKAPS